MACLFLLNVNYMYPLCIFKIFINSKIRKGARKIFIKTVFKAQENQRFSMVTKLKLCAFAFNFFI